MNHRARIVIPVLLAALLAPVAGATPRAATDIVHAEPFVLEAPFRSNWSAERPEVHAGWLVVLAVEPELVVPRQTAQPILQAGAESVIRLNVGHESGRLVAIIPSAIDSETGEPALDLAAEPVFFGEPGLPEQLTRAAALAARDAALDAGIRPFPANRLQSARRKGGESRVHAGQRALWRRGMELVRLHAPDEQDLADGWLDPLTPVIR